MDKSTVHKTAEYVLKNGRLFEERLRSGPEAAKFAFLEEGHPLHEYYKKLVEPEKVAKDEELVVGDLQFYTEVPPISTQDAEAIKLAAMFVARNGPSYTQALLNHQRKTGNKHQFGFLVRSHSLHPVFQKFVKQYELLIKYNEGDGDAATTLDRIHQPAKLFERAWARAQVIQKSKDTLEAQQKAEQQKQLHYASIDWQDFVLVGRVRFDAVDEVKELAVPLEREALVYRSLQARASELKLETASVEKAPEPIKEAPTQLAGMKIRAAGESRLRKKAAVNTITCPLTNQAVPEDKFDEHLRVLLRDPRYKEQQDNYLRKNFTYATNLTTDQVYDNIKRLARKRGADN